jgi:squalene-hopene/tetraprenyl-beta-curcumene cyclase
MDRSASRIPQASRDAFARAIDRAREWVVGMQSENGGWAAFDADNEYYYLNEIPFADHGALLDPPTADVTARCVSMLAQLGASTSKDEALDQGIAYLLHAQETDGSWYGRWGMNYIYGTWSVLCALNAARLAFSAPAVRKAVQWLHSIQNKDGGWGEGGDSYRLDYQSYEQAPSTASQTAWALLALMAAGEVDHPSVAKAVAYLLENQADDGFWNEAYFTATGFPRVFYLRYHGYAKFFPLWALARYRNLKSANTASVLVGM